MKNLVIVESPSKANTINKYLGADFLVKATMGHIKDLPKNRMAVDVENNFEPHYEIIKGKEKVTEEIKRSAKNAEVVYLAPDPDREGEAIAWNVKEIIDSIKGKKPEVKRVLFNEITKDSVRDAIMNPVNLNEFMWESQKARRILDRLVGYNLSPFLWGKIRRGLSAGRVQSVALYLIVEREKEIIAFKSEEYWTLTALFNTASDLGILTDLSKINKKDPEIKTAEDAEKLKNTLLKIDNFKISDIDKKSVKRNPPLPFITSTLQQEAFKTLRFSVKKTMEVAQRLYEGVGIGAVARISDKPLGPTGLITYMRTDSTRISDIAVKTAKDYIKSAYGEDYIKDAFTAASKKQKGKKIQDAHEAIRPANIFLTPKRIKQYLDNDEYRLYNLIWTIFLASQMSRSVYDQYSISISGKFEDEYLFKATESVLKFDGYQRVIAENLKPAESREDGAKTAGSIFKMFDLLSVNEPLNLKNADLLQHFTAPPPRYTEASLVKALDENGIGRPSTYQAIIANIKNKDYVTLEKDSSSTAKFKPTELGIMVSDILKAGFPDILDIKFTANMENKLDEIEQGTIDRKTLLLDFYARLQDRLKLAVKDIKDIKGTSVPTDIKCEKCGRPMVIKFGRFGKFLACSGYPECKNTKELAVHTKEGATIEPAASETTETSILCDKCGRPMVIKNGRFGKFLACSGYPECKNTKPMPLKSNIPCPTGCGGYLSLKRTKKGRKFYGCSNYPDCNYVTWNLPKQEGQPPHA